MIVPVAVVSGVAVLIMDIVDMALVGHGHMAASFAVGVVVAGMLAVAPGGALVEVTVVAGVEVAVMDVVDVIAVGDGDMAATVAVDVGVIGVLDMGSGHCCSSCECRMASLTMWPTWASASW